MELKPCDRSVIERALGIIEGVATAFRHDEQYEAAEGMLITAVEMIDEVLNKVKEETT